MCVWKERSLRAAASSSVAGRVGWWKGFETGLLCVTCDMWAAARRGCAGVVFKLSSKQQQQQQIQFLTPFVFERSTLHTFNLPPSTITHSFQAHLDDAAFALELADLEADGSSSSSTANSTAAAAASELASLLGQAKSSLQQLSAGLDKWELRMLLSGPYDEAGALLTITAGAGGVATCCPGCWVVWG